VRKLFSRDHCCRGRSKPGCRIVVGSRTPWHACPSVVADRVSMLQPSRMHFQSISVHHPSVIDSVPVQSRVKTHLHTGPQMPLRTSVEEHIIDLQLQSLLNQSNLLLPMSMMTMLELECWRASSSQVVRWLKVSRLSITHSTFAFPLSVLMTYYFVITGPLHHLDTVGWEGTGMWSKVQPVNRVCKLTSSLFTLLKIHIMPNVHHWNLWQAASEFFSLEMTYKTS